MQPAAALTSDLLLQAEDHCHGLVQHQQFGLWLLTLQVQLTHVTKLLKRLVDVPHTQTLTGIVGHPPLALTFGLLLRAQVLILMDTTTSTRCEKNTGKDIIYCLNLLKRHISVFKTDIQV